MKGPRAGSVGGKCGAGESGPKVTAADSFSSTITNTWRTWNLPPRGAARAGAAPTRNRTPASAATSAATRVGRSAEPDLTAGRLTSATGYGNQIRHPQHRDHRPRRPRQDDPGRRAAVAVGRFPLQPGRGRARAGLDGPRTREGDH